MAYPLLFRVMEHLFGMDSMSLSIFYCVTTLAPFPPPCLTILLEYLEFKLLPLGLRTFKLPSRPFKLYFDSSLHNTLFQSLIVQCLRAFANSILAFLFFGGNERHFRCSEAQKS